MKKIALFIFSLTFALNACSDQKQATSIEQNKPMQNLTLYFNKETGAEFAARTQSASSNPLPTSSTTFYNLDWDKNPIDLKIEHGQNTITLQHVIGVQAGVGDSDKLITGYHVFAGLTNEDTMSHDQARLTMLAILQQLTTAGWQHFISLSDPRLIGKEAFNYFFQDTTYGMDPSYQLTLDEWMRLENGASWILHANGVFLTIDLRRDQKLMDANKPGAYFVRYDFESEKRYFAPYFRDEDLKKWEINAARWVELYPGIKKEMNRIRAKKEAALKAQGIRIDESYQDPALVSKQ